MIFFGLYNFIKLFSILRDVSLFRGGGGHYFGGEGHNFFPSCMVEGHNFFQGFLGEGFKVFF